MSIENLNKFEKIFKTKTGSQTAALYGVNIFSLMFSFGASLLLAKFLGPFGYGKYSFYVALITLLALFSEVGLFPSVSRLLVQCPDAIREREVIGTSIIMLGLLSGVFIFFNYAFGQNVDLFVKDEIGYLVRQMSILSFTFFLPSFVEFILKGTNDIYLLSMYNVMWKFWFFVFVVIIYLTIGNTASNTIVAFTSTCLLAFIFTFLIKKPIVKHVKVNVKDLLKMNRSYGIHLYLGRMIDLATYSLDTVLISAFHGLAPVAIYSISYSMARPITLFSRSIAQTKFRDFGSEKYIQPSIIRYGNIATIIGSAISLIFGYLIVRHILKGDYLECLYIIPILILAVAFQASYQIYNSWLGSNGYGLLLRKKSIFTACSNIVLNFALIPKYGAVGASVASAISMAHSYYLTKMYYQRSILELGEK